MILWGLWIFKRQNMVIINDILLQLVSRSASPERKNGPPTSKSQGREWMSRKKDISGYLMSMRVYAYIYIYVPCRQ